MHDLHEPWRNSGNGALALMTPSETSGHFDMSASANAKYPRLMSGLECIGAYICGQPTPDRNCGAQAAIALLRAYQPECLQVLIGTLHRPQRYCRVENVEQG